MLPSFLMWAAAPFVLFVIFAFHEYGHYVMARVFGVPIDGVSIGFGKIFREGVTAKGVAWTLRRFPFSGAVKLNYAVFDQRPLVQRVLIILAGPVFNVVLAFLVLFPVYTVIGQPVVPAVLTSIKIDSIGDKAGFEIGDRIVAVDGAAVRTLSDLTDVSKRVPPRELLLSVVRDGAERFDISLTPSEHHYVDIKGIERRRGVIGFSASQAPVNLDDVVSVNGVTAEDKDQARELLIQHFDQQIIVVLDGEDNQESYYKTRVHGDLNQHLFDEDHKRYEVFYFGGEDAPYYRDLNIVQSASVALETVGELFVNVLTLPTQVMPIDKTKLRPKVTVHDEALMVRNTTFAVAYFMSMISIFIGFVNLIPLPHFDGGQLMFMIAQRFQKAPLSNKQKSWLVVCGVGGLYFTMLMFNAQKVPLYVGAKVQAFNEWRDEKS